MAQHLTGIRLGAVHIIESLPAGELRTGERLFEELQPLGFTLQPNIETSFWRDGTRGAFLGRFDAILQQLRADRRAPLIHIETHGLFDEHGVWIGFSLASGEVVTWGDLKPLLTAINVTCCINLMVVSGACEGASLAKVLQASEPAPSWGVLGPTRTVSAEELEDAHLAFYKTLYGTRDLGPAIVALNDSVREGDRPFVLLDADWFFRGVMERYFERYRTEESIEARVRKAARTEEELRRQGIPDDEILRRREAYRAYLRNHRGHFDDMKARFFAIDKCPSNASRFPVSYEDVAPEVNDEHDR